MSNPTLQAPTLGRPRMIVREVAKGGIGKVYQVFGDEFNRLLDELNEALAA